MIVDHTGFFLWTQTVQLSVFQTESFGATGHIVVLRSHFLVPAVCVQAAFAVQIVVFVFVQGVKTFVIVFGHDLDAGFEFGA